MSDNVIEFPGETTVDIPVEKVLECARKAGLDKLVLVGQYPDGSFYFAGNTSDCMLINWLLDQAKKDTLECEKIRR